MQRFSRFNLADQVTAGCFSHDGGHLLYGMSYSREILGYQFTMQDGKVSIKEIFRFPTPHKDTISSIHASTRSKIILTSGERTSDGLLTNVETMVYLHDSKGTLLHQINTNQMRNNMYETSDLSFCNYMVKTTALVYLFIAFEHLNRFAKQTDSNVQTQ